MAEWFLEEQLKRMKEMSEQMSRATTRAAELSSEMARDREAIKQGPLQEVRDLRTYSSPRKKSRGRSDDHAGTARRDTARDSTRRRRK
jgi:hypothetical protein